MLFLRRLVLLFSFLGFQSQAQDNEWWKQKSPSGTFVIGAGPNFIGLNAKAGLFLKNNFMLGVNSEVHHFLSTRKEVGVFGRKYLNTNRLSFFVQSGVAYGRFEEWGSFDLDTPPAERKERMEVSGLKINGSGGGEIKLSRRFGLEGEIGIGKILNTQWWAPSIRGSLNYRFLK